MFDVDSYRKQAESTTKLSDRVCRVYYKYISHNDFL